MSKLVTDPNSPGLGHGADTGPVPQNEEYLVLPEEEIAKGFVRPLRYSYRHVGVRPEGQLRQLTPEEHVRYDKYDYVYFEAYPEDRFPLTGRYWTFKQLHSGCGAVTTMSEGLAKTYARDPSFYGATYCVGCRMHLPVEQFEWTDDGERVGS